VAGRLTIIGGGVMGLFTEAASGVDTCWYDPGADDDFILGAVPGADGI
jgi:hypothetical protein